MLGREAVGDLLLLLLPLFRMVRPEESSREHASVAALNVGFESFSTKAGKSSSNLKRATVRNGVFVAELSFKLECWGPIRAEGG